MSNSPGQSQLMIERILRDRDGIWRQISEGRDLRGLGVQTLTTSVVSLAIFGLVLGFSNGPQQALSSMVKLPLLFLATLAICLPTLYLFNLVFGARLSIAQAVALIMVSITVIAGLTLAFAPISLFFLITAQNYAFFKLLNVCILALTAFVGLRFLTAGMAALNTHHETSRPVAMPVVEPAPRELALVGAAASETAANGSDGGTATATVSAPAPAPAPPGNPAAAPPGPSTPDRRPASMKLVYIWILLYGFVGTQLAWTLRPFFGDPDAPFALFREISGTFYSDILRTIGDLFS
jgi:hypothetical protein